MGGWVGVLLNPGFMGRCEFGTLSAPTVSRHFDFSNGTIDLQVPACSARHRTKPGVHEGVARGVDEGITAAGKMQHNLLSTSWGSEDPADGRQSTTESLKASTEPMRRQEAWTGIPVESDAQWIAEPFEERRTVLGAVYGYN
ncbi:hypothetical protein NDU88_012562 [Pleurodeles waltl]|uniref:Uncharacterized protein n=1 Tax=Pleurodeles waltl TaxID=8319 RepID=A0AAV7R4Z3_PLEWA|nr:hypothetical protein NDU88_012562 [Pleurodeles waltl]